MCEEWKTKGELLQELDHLRSRIAQLEQSKYVDAEKGSLIPKEAFRSFFNNVCEGVLLQDPENGHFIGGNQMICEMLGCDVEEIENLEVTDIYLQEDLDRVKKRLGRHVNGETAVTKEILVKKMDGSVFLADIASVPLTLADKTHVISFFKKIPSRTRRIKSKLPLEASADSDANQYLTISEIRVLRLIAKGMTCREIAQLLHRSVRTIQNHRTHLMDKLGVDNSVTLVKKAIEMELVELHSKT